MPMEMSDQYASYLHDESRLSGRAESISFPETEAGAAAMVKQCHERRIPVTAQGSRTGLCGGAVPRGGHALNLSRLASPLNIRRDGEGFLLTVRPGLTLSALHEALRARRFDWEAPDTAGGRAEQAFRAAPDMFWPPDPSELTATVGGVISTNGRGPGAFKYGSASAHVHSLRVIMAGGDIAEAMNTPDDRLFAAVTGGEGMFGVVTAATLRLVPKPAEVWGIVVLFNDEDAAAAFLDRAKALALPALAALDFLDGASLKMVAELKKVAARLKQLPGAPESAAAAA
jgi:D-lactate dehydrogenase (cytochrome)